MKQLFISHFPKKDTEAQGGDGLLEVTQQEWLSWVGFVSHPSSPTPKTPQREGLKVPTQDLRI